nr:MAG TPA: hypothetical protein [Inoviridae sp.]
MGGDPCRSRSTTAPMAPTRPPALSRMTPCPR